MSPESFKAMPESGSQDGPKTERMVRTPFAKATPESGPQTEPKTERMMRAPVTLRSETESDRPPVVVDDEEGEGPQTVRVPPRVQVEPQKQTPLNRWKVPPPGLTDESMYDAQWKKSNEIESPVRILSTSPETDESGLPLGMQNPLNRDAYRASKARQEQTWSKAVEEAKKKEEEEMVRALQRYGQDKNKQGKK